MSCPLEKDETKDLQTCLAIRMQQKWRQPVATGIPNMALERNETNKGIKEEQGKRENGKWNKERKKVMKD